METLIKPNTNNWTDSQRSRSKDKQTRGFCLKNTHLVFIISFICFLFFTSSIISSSCLWAKMNHFRGKFRIFCLSLINWSPNYINEVNIEMKIVFIQAISRGSFSLFAKSIYDCLYGAKLLIHVIFIKWEIVEWFFLASRSF